MTQVLITKFVLLLLYLSCTASKGKGKFKGKVHPRRGHEGPEGKKRSFFNLGAGWGGWSKPRPGRFTSPGEDLVPMVSEAAWTPGPVWMVWKILPPNGIQSLGCPVCSELPVQLVREIFHMNISYGCKFRGIEVYVLWSLFSLVSNTDTSGLGSILLIS
jgi:hypothetical protein